MLMWLQKYFGLHKRERNGVVVLLVLILLIWLLPLLYDYFIGVDLKQYEQLLAAQKVLPVKTETIATPAAHQTDEIRYFTFNPNHLAVSDWQRLGLNERQINNIKNYEKHGGQFRRKEDLKKIYTLKEADYKKLEPYIRIPHSQKTGSKEGTSSHRLKLTVKEKQVDKRPGKSLLAPGQISLNQADSLELMQLPGIGVVFASRIVRYRQLLGGFYSKEQLLEVYGMDSLRYEQILPYLSLKKNGIKQIPINDADYEQLRRHPYIRGKYANLIIQFRKQHGAFASINDLAQINVFNQEFLHKIAPYLTFLP